MTPNQTMVYAEFYCGLRLQTPEGGLTSVKQVFINFINIMYYLHILDKIVETAIMSDNRKHRFCWYYWWSVSSISQS